MGMMRKITSVSTFGLVDFRSDKEKAARYTKQTRDSAREQEKMMREQQKREAQERK